MNKGKGRTYLTLAAVMRSFILAATVEAYLYALAFYKLQYQTALPHRSEKAVLNEFE
jgi:hypothetical protein